MAKVRQATLSEFNLPLRGPAMEEHPVGAVQAAEATHK